MASTCHHEDGEPNAKWILFGCCSPTKCGHLQAAFRRRSNAADLGGCPPYLVCLLGPVTRNTKPLSTVISDQISTKKWHQNDPKEEITVNQESPKEKSTPRRQRPSMRSVKKRMTTKLRGESLSSFIKRKSAVRTAKQKYSAKHKVIYGQANTIQQDHKSHRRSATNRVV